MFCHLRISVAGSSPRTVAFELRPDVCPRTCANFAALCRSPATARRPPSSSSSRGRGGPGQSHGDGVAEPTYRGTEFHRIVPGFMIQGGDFERFDGTGGRAAPSTNDGNATFPDETFDMPHDKEGVLSMANRGKHTNGSQFFVTLGRASHLDGKHVAFGRVVRGMDVVRDAARVECEGTRPVAMQRVVVVDCGMGMGDDEEEEEEESDSDGNGSSSESSGGGRRRSRPRKRSRRARSSSSESSKDRRRRSRSKRRRRRGRDRRKDDDSSGGSPPSESSSDDDGRRRSRSRKRRGRRKDEDGSRRGSSRRRKRRRERHRKDGSNGDGERRRRRRKGKSSHRSRSRSRSDRGDRSPSSGEDDGRRRRPPEERGVSDRWGEGGGRRGEGSDGR